MIRYSLPDQMAWRSKVVGGGCGEGAVGGRLDCHHWCLQCSDLLINFDLFTNEAVVFVIL